MMGWGDMRPESASIRERYKKKKRNEQREHHRQKKRDELNREYQKAKAAANKEKMREVEDEKTKLKKLARFTKLKERAKEFVKSDRIHTGDLDMVLAHVESYQGVKYIDMFSVWDDDIGIVTKIGETRLNLCLGWLEEQGIIVSVPDDELPAGHCSYYTTEYLSQKKSGGESADNDRGSVSKLSSTGRNDC